MLDPFRRVSAEAARYRAAFNPLTILRGPSGEGLGAHAIEDAGLIADALVVAASGDTHWDDAGRKAICQAMRAACGRDPGVSNLKKLVRGWREAEQARADLERITHR